MICCVNKSGAIYPQDGATDELKPTAHVQQVLHCFLREPGAAVQSIDWDGVK